MAQAADISARLAFDVQSLESLRSRASSDPQAALKEAAKQFEAVLLNMMLKSMREAGGGQGLFESQETRLYTSMLDQQLAQNLGTKGLGLADVMVQQLTRSRVAEATEGLLPLRLPDRIRAPVDAEQASGAAAPSSAEASRTPEKDFVSKVWQHAVEASRATGLPAHFMVGHAALESGWGRGEIRHADGSPSHNLFGIKAGRGWSGPTVDSVTTEYVDGKAVRTVEKFRAYGSYAEAFRDYAALLGDNPRYRAVLDHVGNPAAFARELQRAGYATDPAYADKLSRILTGGRLRDALVG